MTSAGLLVARKLAVTNRAFMAVDDATGDPIGLDDIDTRAGWLLDLITESGAELLGRLWRPTTFDTLAAGRDRTARRLPLQGNAVAARLGWTPHYPDGVYVPSRVGRVVTGQVVATLRTLAHRDRAIIALAARFDPESGHLAPQMKEDVDVPAAFARGVYRQLVAWARRHAQDNGGQTVSTSVSRLRVTDMQAVPGFARIARLAAADKQLAHLAANDTDLVLTVTMPTCPNPAHRADWRRVRLTAAIPPHLRDRPITQWHLPTLEIDHRGLLWRCAITELVPATNADTATRAVGVDWSPATLGAAAVVAEIADGLVSDFHGWTYDDRGLGIKLARLQIEGQMLHRKAARLRQLAATAPARVRVQLESKISAWTVTAQLWGPNGEGSIGSWHSTSPVRPPITRLPQERRQLEWRTSPPWSRGGMGGSTTTVPHSPPAARPPTRSLTLRLGPVSR